MADTLPEFIEEKTLRDISTVTVPDQALLQCFVQAPKPYLSKSAVAEMTDLGDEGARKRLNSLEDRGVLLSDSAGKQTKIYWLNNPDSRWPVPGDLAEVSPQVRSSSATIARIHRLSELTLVYGGVFVALYMLDWLSGFGFTDGIFALTLNWTVMPALAFALLGTIFYIGLQTTLHVEDNGSGLAAVRRFYDQVTE